jgi:hypothetical protein
MTKLKCLLAGLLTATWTASASAGAILDWEGTGVDFYASWLDADTLRIEIDAGDITAGSGWDGATYIDSIAINGPDAWSWVNASDITLLGPGTFSGPVDGTGLNASGCQGLDPGQNHQCWTGLASLVDDMYFDFTFSGDAVISAYIDAPHLKVRFVDDQGNKVGSLLSANVPEPSSIALLCLGVIGLAIARKQSR